MYGPPDRLGTHLSFFFKTAPNSIHVHIDVFLGRIDGNVWMSPTWGNRNVVSFCEYPYTGVQYVDFFGEAILAPTDQEAYMNTAYGSDWMIPAGILGYRSAYTYRYNIKKSGYFGTSDVAFTTSLMNFRFLCDAQAPCHSIMANEILLSRMLSHIRLIASDHSLHYTLACHALVHATSKLPVPPSYAAVAVPHTEATTWLQSLQSMHQTSTFVMEQHGDGSLAHIVYSRYSTTRLVLWSLDGIWPAHVQSMRFGGHGNFSAVAADNGRYDELVGLCKACGLCEPMRHANTTMPGGRLQNVGTGLCVEASSKDKGRVQLGECHEVWDTAGT